MVAQKATLSRGLEVLIALGEEEGESGLGVVRVAELVGREKSQVSRTLKTLADFGLVDREPGTLVYRLGWRLYALAARAGDARLLSAAPALLLRLVGDLGETAHLSVLRGREVLTVASESPPHAVQAAGWIGRVSPAYCTSSGRALLFDHDREQLEALFAGCAFDARGPNAPDGLGALQERIALTRTRGFAVADEEFETGLVAAAAPVRDFRGRIVAAVNVSAPKFRFGDRLEEAGRLIKATADELSALLGLRDRDLLERRSSPRPGHNSPASASSDEERDPCREGRAVV